MFLVSGVENVSMQVRTLQSFDKHSEACSVMTFALEAHPSSVSLWLLRLTMGSPDSSQGDEGKVLENLCRDALGMIPVKVCELRTLYVSIVQLFYLLFDTTNEWHACSGHFSC